MGSPRGDGVGSPIDAHLQPWVFKHFTSRRSVLWSQHKEVGNEVLRMRIGQKDKEQLLWGGVGVG